MTIPPTNPAAWNPMLHALESLLQMQTEQAKAHALEPGAIPDPEAWKGLVQRYASLGSALLQSFVQREPGAPGTPVVVPEPGDRRFAATEWRDYPYFDLLKQSYLLASQFMHEWAGLIACPEEERQRLQFWTQQFVDAMAPSNFIATNPEAIREALATQGESVQRGLANLAHDVERGRIAMSDEHAFEVGRNLAVTPGEVVFRNELIELIQYRPQTAQVYERPLLIVPPCINKFYILDLQPHNSFVRHAVEQGHTVFLVSWRNVPSELGHLTWDDYLTRGVMQAITVTKAVSRSKQVNTLGFCVGGTLLASALAVMGAHQDESASSVTLLTTMLDFDEPGEISVYLDPEQLEARASRLTAGERMQGGDLASAFASLRSNELVWYFVINNYLRGRTPAAFDLLYWNGDSANLPGPMYLYYIREMYLRNKLRVPDALTMCGTRVDLGRITIPAYVLATREDHIVPWRSAYKTTALLGAEVRFVLGASGHIAGVINPAAKGKRNYWTNRRSDLDAEAWLEGAFSHAGSWWNDWREWLAVHGGALRAAPRRTGSAKYPALGPAPGTYVLEKAR
jgi:polyhydroxyalkanoate synthase